MWFSRLKIKNESLKLACNTNYRKKLILFVFKKVSLINRNTFYHQYFSFNISVGAARRSLKHTYTFNFLCLIYELLWDVQRNIQNV